MSSCAGPAEGRLSPVLLELQEASSGRQVRERGGSPSLLPGPHPSSLDPVCISSPYADGQPDCPPTACPQGALVFYSPSVGYGRPLGSPLSPALYWPPHSAQHHITLPY
ncbi:estrogen receptor beta-1-like [Sardina pilchardus]|uniref:estrogen receptor beta-1-like n=1 Tax=Sardina pilchardus TaxID=27697 RepID=UPI002E0FEF9F